MTLNQTPPNENFLRTPLFSLTLLPLQLQQVNRYTDELTFT